MRRVRLRRAWEGGLYEHAQSYIHATLMMGVFSCVCSGVLWGRGGLQCRILGGVIVSFFGGASRRALKQPKIYDLYYMFYIIEAVSAVVVSLYATAGRCWFSVCWGHGTDVPRAEMCTAWFGNSTCLLLRVAGRWRSTSLTTLIRVQR